MRSAGWILAGALLAGVPACSDDDPAPTPAPASDAEPSLEPSLEPGLQPGLRLGPQEPVSVDGSRVSRAAGQPSASADGDLVAFTAARRDLRPTDPSSDTAVFVSRRSTGTSVLASAAADGTPADRPASMPAISGSGRFVAFVSDAPNLGAGSGSREHVYVKDLETGAIVRASADAAGRPAAGDSSDPVLSGDGTRVAFVSRAANLTPGDANTSKDVYLKDLTTGQVTLVSEVDGRAIGGLTPDLSADGRAVVFDTEAAAVEADAAKGERGVFVRDLTSGVLSMVSVSGADPAGGSCPAISSDGVRVAFVSAARKLVREDTNNVPDVFVRELRRGTLSRVSVAAPNAQLDTASGCPDFSGDAVTVLFPSGDVLLLKDLVTGDLLRVGPDTGDYALSASGRVVAFRVRGEGVVRRERQ